MARGTKIILITFIIINVAIYLEIWILVIPHKTFGRIHSLRELHTNDGFLIVDV